ncbi:hypothetical protein D3C73_945060 [compost metagenome]
MFPDEVVKLRHLLVGIEGDAQLVHRSGLIQPNDTVRNRLGSMLFFDFYRRNQPIQQVCRLLTQCDGGMGDVTAIQCNHARTSFAGDSAKLI